MLLNMPLKLAMPELNEFACTYINCWNVFQDTLFSSIYKMYPHRSRVFSHSHLLTCLSHNPQHTSLLRCCPNFLTVSCKWSVTCVDFPVEMRFYSWRYDTVRSMSFGLCHLSITCYIMGDLHSGASRLTKVLAFEQIRTEDRCYIPLADNCSVRLFPTVGRVL